MCSLSSNQRARSGNYTVDAGKPRTAKHAHFPSTPRLIIETRFAGSAPESGRRPQMEFQMFRPCTKSPPVCQEKKQKKKSRRSIQARLFDEEKGTVALADSMTRSRYAVIACGAVSYDPVSDGDDVHLTDKDYEPAV